MSAVYARVPHAGDDPGGGVGEDQSGASQTVAARMEDRSSGGACIRVKTAIGVGSKVRVQWCFEQFSGTAKYCRSEGRKYVVGIQRDLVKNPIPSQPVPANISAQKGAGNSIAAASTVKSENLLKAEETTPSEIPPNAVNAESVPMVLTAAPAGATLPHSAGYETDDGEKPRNSRLDEFDALRRTQFKTKQSPKGAQVVKERNPMQRKWLEPPWSNKPDGLGVSDDRGGRRKQQRQGREGESQVRGQSIRKKGVSAREVPNFQVELSAMEDIYRAAGIMLPRIGIQH